MSKAGKNWLSGPSSKEKLTGCLAVEQKTSKPLQMYRSITTTTFIRCFSQTSYRPQVLKIATMKTWESEVMAMTLRQREDSSVVLT